MSQSIQLQVTQVGLEQSIAAAMRRVGNSSQINLGTNSRQINALSQPLGRITGQADEFSKSMAAANARVLAFGASAGIIAGVSSAMAGLLQSTIKVEKSLVEINSVLNKSSSELDKFGQDIFNVAKNTGKSFQEVADGALELARQGLSAEDTLTRLNDALILSRLSGLDAAQSVEGLTAAFNSFQKSGITTAEILNKVVAISQKYAVSERDIIEGVKRSASVAQQAGVSFEELAALITAVQQTTARGGAVIGNSFKTIFARIQRKDVLSDLQDLGVTVTDFEGNVLPALKILESLASQLNSFSQIEQASIAEKLGGVFQLDKLLAALKDLSSESSVAQGALAAAANAGNSAYEKNIILNQTLSSLLNKVSVSAEQLGAKLGEIGVTDSLKNVLGFFNNLLEGIQRILGEESGLGNVVRGLVKGLGSFLAGPGLALFAGIILKLSKDLVQFGFASLKAFFGIGKAAKEVQNVESAISQILAKNVNLQQQLFALEGNRAAQLRVITTALVEQEALLRRSAAISSGLAAPLYGAGVRAGSSGLRVGNSAGGYMPAVAKESASIRQGVGGARAGDRPVVIPNFSFGGGKKGTMVAHTGEYIIPNFNGSGGSAVFNRSMVQSMGLPSGAKKIGAAGGFIPNYARGAGLGPAGLLSQLKLTGNESINDVRSILSNNFPIKSASDKAVTVKYGNEDIYITNDSINTSLKKRSQLSQELYYDSNQAPGALMLVPQNRPFNANALNTKFTNKRNQSGVIFDGFLGGLAGVNPSPDDKKFASLTNVDNEIAGALSNSAINILKRIEPGIKIQPNSLLNPKNILNSVLAEGGAGAFGAFKGALFESVIKLVTKGKGQEGGTLDVDLDQGRDALEAIFGIKGKGYKYADFKNSTEQKDKFISQVMTNLPVQSYPAKQQKGMALAASGYVPNFANALQEAVDREMAAGVPASQIYIDKNSALKNASNPMGLMVANRRDEPAGGFQGINRARREGVNPMMYGAAGGFIPNYAPQLGQLARPDLGRLKINDQAINDFNASLKQISDQLRKGAISFADANSKVTQLAQSTGSTKAQVTKLAAVGGNLITAYNNELTARNQKAQQLKQDRAENRKASQDSGGGRDMLGTIFAVQGALSALTGATDGATGGLAIFTNGLSSAAGSATTFLFASQGLSQAFGGAEKGVGKFLGKLGPYGAAAAFIYTGVKEFATYLDKTNPEVQKAAESMSKVSDAASKAAINLNNLNPAQKESVKLQADRLQAKALTTRITGAARTGVMRTKFDGVTDEVQTGFNNLLQQAIGVGLSEQEILDTVQSRSKDFRLTSKDIDEISNILSGKILSTSKQGSPQSIIKGLTEERKKELAGMSPQDIENAIAARGAEGGSELKDLQDLFFEAGVKGDTARQEAIRKTIELLQEQANSQADVEKEKEKSFKINLSKLQTEIEFNKRLDQIKQGAFLNESNIKAEIAKIENSSNLSEDEKAKKVLELNSALELQAKAVDNITQSQENLKNAIASGLEESIIDPSQYKEAFDKLFQEIQSRSDLTDILLKDPVQFATEINNILQKLQIPDDIAKPLIKGLSDALITNKDLSQEAEKQITLSLQQLGIETEKLNVAQQRAGLEKLISAQIESQNSESSFKIENRVLNNAYETLSINKEIEQIKRETSLNELQKAEQVYKLELKRRDLESTGIGIGLEQNLLNIDQELIGKARQAIESSQLIPKTPLGADLTIQQLEERAAIDPIVSAQIKYAKDNAKRQADLAKKTAENQQAGLGDVVPDDTMVKAGEGFFGGMKRGITALENQTNTFASDIGEKIPQMFSDNMSNAINKMIEGGESFSSVLRGAAYEFVKGINQANIQNLSNKFSNFLFKSDGQAASSQSGGGFSGFLSNLFASGGMVNGGSGMKDDVPAMLMGGEYVVNKKAVSKYGAQFLESINNGTLTGYAKGGKVQTGPQGNFYTPGTFGQGAISGKRNLLDFATQTGTSGQFDQIINELGYQSVSLEPESSRLSVSGMRNSPQFEATQSAKQQAFDLYLQQYNAEKEAKKAEEAQKKAFRTQLLMLAVSAGLGAVGSVASTGAKTALANLPKDAGVLEKLMTAASGAFKGGNIAGTGQMAGGLKNLFSGNFATAFRSGIPLKAGAVGGSYGNVAVGAARSGTGVILDGSILPQFNSEDKFGKTSGYYPSYQVFGKRSYLLGGGGFGSLLPPKNAIGGMIPSTSGIDTVPAMLSGGEFVMNRSAVQGIGAQNLQSMNSGGTSITSEETSKELNEKLLAKLDELINSSGSTGNITINVAPSGQTTQETSQDPSAGRQQLARQIKDAVLQIINDEKRIGGTLRR